MAVLLLTLSAISAAQQIAIGEYPVPGNALGITAGPDGALWFTDYDFNKIGRITTAGLVTEYSIPTPGSGAWGITAGPDGALWFTEYDGHKIGRITTGGVISEYPVSGRPWGITVGPDGALWFTEGGKIGRITTGGMITEYPAYPAHLDVIPMAITVGPDDALWFGDCSSGGIGRITTAGVVTLYSIPTRTTYPAGITAGPDGALWFTEIDGNKIGRITTAGVITEYPLVDSLREPQAITAGPDGALWFTTYNHAIGRITTAGVITVYPAGKLSGNWEAITAGPDGSLWFGGDTRPAVIGEAVFVTAGLSVSPASGIFRTSLTFTGSAFAPNESVQIYSAGIGSPPLATAMTDAVGSFTATAPEPTSPNGHRLFLGVGQSSGKLGAADFSVTPRLILTPKVGIVGSTTTALAFGFDSQDEVKIYWNSPRTFLGTATANLYGTAALTFTVPTGAPVGVNKVYGKGYWTGATGGGSFTVQ